MSGAAGQGCNVALFCEDFGHEAFISAIIRRVAGESGVDVQIAPRSVRGGHGKVIAELKQLLRDLDRARQALPDLLVVAIDPNCKGLQAKLREIHDGNEKYQPFIVTNVPDPHIERWLLLDPAAFKNAVGNACAVPGIKCERDRYKRLLIDAVRDAGVSPLLGGLEYAEDIAQAMDFRLAGGADSSLSHFLSGLRAKFKQWLGEPS